MRDDTVPPVRKYRWRPGPRNLRIDPDWGKRVRGSVPAVQARACPGTVSRTMPGASSLRKWLLITYIALDTPPLPALQGDRS